MTIRSARAIIIASIIVLSISACGLIAINRREPLAIAEPPISWRLGSSLPSDAQCYWEWTGWRLAYCQDATADMQIRFNMTTRRIERLTQNLHHVTIGQLIAMRGQPRGANIYSTFIYVYYRDCYAVIYTEHFSPVSPIYYLAWDDNIPTVMGTWSGFVDR